MSSAHLTKAKTHLAAVDPILFAVAEKVGWESPTAMVLETDFFTHLCREIVGQQLSTKVARVIWDRFVILFAKSGVTPDAVLEITPEELRVVGLSRAKILYVKDLAEKVKTQTVDLAVLPTLADEDVITHLIQVKGIGRWTAEMFLIFTLGRPDVFSVGDLGLRRAIEKIYGLSEDHVLKNALEMSQKWAPYRSYASLMLWKSLDNLPALV